MTTEGMKEPSSAGPNRSTAQAAVYGRMMSWYTESGKVLSDAPCGLLTLKCGEGIFEAEAGKGQPGANIITLLKRLHRRSET